MNPPSGRIYCLPTVMRQGVYLSLDSYLYSPLMSTIIGFLLWVRLCASYGTCLHETCLPFIRKKLKADCAEFYSVRSLNYKDALCPKCGSLESIEYLIYECESLDSLWREMDTWINNIVFTNFQIDDRKKNLREPKILTFYDQSYIVCN